MTMKNVDNGTKKYIRTIAFLSQDFRQYFWKSRSKKTIFSLHTNHNLLCLKSQFYFSKNLKRQRDILEVVQTVFVPGRIRAGQIFIDCIALLADLYTYYADF